MSHKTRQAEERAQQILQELLRQAATTPELAEILIRRLQAELARFSAWCKRLAMLPRAERRRSLRRLGTSLGGVGLALTLALSQAPPAQAASITVNGSCSLINAIIAANTDSATGGCSAGSGADTISLPGGTITLTTVNNSTGTGDNGLPIITSTITIDGNGTTITRSSASSFRILDVTSSGNLTLNNTTISGGNSPYNGGGIRNKGALTLNDSTVSGNSANNAGGIINTGSGTLTLTNSTVSGNSAYGAGGGFVNFGTATLSGSTVSDNDSTNQFGGGGISNYGTLTLTGSTVSGNDGYDFGGGILNSSTLTVTNSTLSGNSARNGGGIGNYGTVTLTNSTLSGNSASFYGGGIGNLGTATLERSLISGNSASYVQEIVNYYGTLNAGNYNLFGHSGESNAQAFYGFTPSGSDISATSDGNDPTALASILNTTLQNNGGSTETHALLDGSPALDAAPSGLSDDQRSIARPQGPDFDIGAFEQEQCVGPASGQLSCWPGRLDADDVWDSNHGTLQNGATFAPGLVGQAFSLDGSNDNITIPDSILHQTTLSIDAWFQTTSGGVIIGYQNTAYSTTPTNFVPALYVGTDGKLRGEFWRGSIAPIVSSSTVNDGNWHHVALTANVNTQSLYLDGVLVGSASGTINPLNMTKNQIGIGYTALWPAGNSGWYGFNGLLDQVRVYNRALSLAEIEAIYAGMGTGVPVATNDTYGTSLNTALNVSAPGVLGNDTDAGGDSLAAVLVSGPAHGSLTLNANGSFTYTPDTGYTGSDSFSYKATDGTYDSNVATVSITVT